MLKFEALAKVLPGDTLEVRCSGDEIITSLCVDSRLAISGALFFCIPGHNADGHNFARQAIDAGAVGLISERELPIDCPQIITRDSRAALAAIAAEFYGNPARELKVLGITGTKGKTTTSFLVKSILEAAGYKVGLIGTVCSMIADTEIPANLTTPDPIDFQYLLRRMADSGVDYVIMEVSAHALSMRRVNGIYYEVGGFSNLSQDHLDYFGGMDEYLAAKLLLFEEGRCGMALYNADDDRVSAAMERVRIPRRALGIRASADIIANDIEIGEKGCDFKLTFNSRFRMSVQLRLPGLFNVYNSLMAAAMCDAAGIKPEAIRAGLESVKSVPGRIELLDTGTPYSVFLDYAHSPDALENILKTVKQIAKGRVIAVFGCGGDRDREKRPIMGEIGGRLADFCVLTSDNPRNEDPFDILADIEEGIKPAGGEYEVIENRRDAIKRALTCALPGDVVVLAGKGHETYQEIKGVKCPFNEKTVVGELLREMTLSA